MNSTSYKSRYLRKHKTVAFFKICAEGTVHSQKDYYEASLEQLLSPGWTFFKPNKEYNVSEAIIQLDLGLGYEETFRYPLNCLNNKLSSSVVELPLGIHKIRLVLKGNREEIRQLHVNFVPIFRFEAICRVAFYLFRLNRLRGISAAQVLYEKWHQICKAGITNIIKNLGEFYDYGDTEKPIGYQQWIQRNECLDHDARQQILNRSFALLPLCSVVCKVSGKLELLASTVDSLRRQFYENWQLLLVVEKKSSSDIVAYIKRTCLDDERIVPVISDYLPSSPLSVEIITRVNGEFCLWLSAGDRFSPLALYYWVKAINDHPAIDVWYCDSDQLDQEGERLAPCYRPSWNKELFYCQDYIGNGCLFHLPTLRKCCNLGELTKGAEKYDILLRIIEQRPDVEIGHISRVLYHNHAGQPYESRRQEATQQRISLGRHFQRLGQKVQVKPGLLPYTHRLIYPLSDILPSVSLIIPTRDQVTILKKCIESIIQKTDYPNYNVIIIDNGSVATETAAYFRKIRENDKIKIVDYKKAFNFAAINNFGARKTDAEIIGLINNDIEVISENWLREMVRHAVQKEVGCVGPKLLYKNGSVQHAGVLCGIGNVAGHAHRYLKRNDPGYFGRLQSSQYFSAVTGACLLVRRSVWQEMGGMNEQLTVAYNDVDFCLRVKKAGYHNVYTPYAELYHHESLSRGPEDTIEKKERYKKEVAYMWDNWKEELENDEFYNPNLSRLREDFSL